MLQICALNELSNHTIGNENHVYLNVKPECIIYPSKSSARHFLWFQKILSIYTPQKFIANSDGEEVPKPKSFTELKWNFHTSGG